MKNQEIAQIFNEIAELLEIKGENHFRIRAYRRAALNIEGLSKSIEDASEKELLEIPGIGHDLAGKIGEYLKTGKLQVHEKLKNEIPEGLLSLLSVPGLGPKTAKMLVEKLQIRGIEDLERLASEHMLAGLPGIKEKTEENIRKGLEMLKQGRERQPLGKVLPIAQEIIEHLKKNANIARIDLAGSIRRRKDSIKDIDILAASDNPQAVMQSFISLANVKEILMQGTTKCSVIIKEGLQVDLRVVDKNAYGSALAYFTGSKAHNIKLREMAVKAGLKINEYGIFHEKNNKRIGGNTEKDIYRILGLDYIPPELREDQGEVEAALEGKLPQLVRLEDIRGDLHVHSQWSDGSHTFEELIDAARKHGYSYIAITDHSKGLGIARGLTEERLLAQKQVITELNKKLKGFTIFHGAEVDIRSNGTLDLSDDVLKDLDIVVASIHSGFKQSSQQLTHRLVSAMRNPYVSIIAHPTGRLIGERDAYDLDMDEVLKTAKQTRTALEINAYPLDYMLYGIYTARRGWLEKCDVANTGELKELLKQLKPHNV